MFNWQNFDSLIIFFLLFFTVVIFIYFPLWNRFFFHCFAFIKACGYWKYSNNYTMIWISLSLPVKSHCIQNYIRNSIYFLSVKIEKAENKWKKKKTISETHEIHWSCVFGSCNNAVLLSLNICTFSFTCNLKLILIELKL